MHLNPHLRTVLFSNDQFAMWLAFYAQLLGKYYWRPLIWDRIAFNLNLGEKYILPLKEYKRLLI